MNEILRPRWARWLLFFVLLLPSAQFAWRNRDMPKFGLLLDDGTVYSAAKSLVAGEGYRIPSLPGKPFETKYPPLYPWYLGAAWKLDAQFPANLRLATLLNWLLLIPYLGLAWVFFRRCGFNENRALLLTGLLGVNPYVILMGTSVSIEVFFTCWLFVVFLVAERKSSGMAFVAGLAAGCAYLSRTAGIALLVAIPLWYLWDRSWRRASAFLAGMMPFVAGWILWTASHRLQTSDPALVYHTDYTAFFFQNMDVHNVLFVAWRNLSELLLGMGSLVVPKVLVFRIEKLLAPPIALGMIAGLVRLARRGIARP